MPLVDFFDVGVFSILLERKLLKVISLFSVKLTSSERATTSPFVERQLRAHSLNAAETDEQMQILGDPRLLRHRQEAALLFACRELEAGVAVEDGLQLCDELLVAGQQAQARQQARGGERLARPQLLLESSVPRRRPAAAAGPAPGHLGHRRSLGDRGSWSRPRVDFYVRSLVIISGSRLSTSDAASRSPGSVTSEKSQTDLHPQ